MRALLIGQDEFDGSNALGVADYRAAIVAAFNQQVQQLDTKLMRQALFLDPRYRAGVADSIGIYALLQQARPFTLTVGGEGVCVCVCV